MSVGVVTAEGVRDALRALRRNDPIRDNALLDLELLRERLSADGLAVSDRALQWALGQVLKYLAR